MLQNMRPTERLVKIKFKVLTTKATTDHEENPQEDRPSSDFVFLVVNEFGRHAESSRA
jgi:hypothetical protein